MKFLKIISLSLAISASIENYFLAAHGVANSGNTRSEKEAEQKKEAAVKSKSTSSSTLKTTNGSSNASSDSSNATALPLQTGLKNSNSTDASLNQNNETTFFPRLWHLFKDLQPAKVDQPLKPVGK